MADLGNKAISGKFMPLWTDEAGLKQSLLVADDGSMTIKMEQDLSGTLDKLHEIRQTNDGYSPSRELRRVAHIPDIVRMHLINNEGWDPLAVENQDRLVKLLNDPDYAFLRAAPGRLAYTNGKMS